ncbi:phage major tail protein, TP901-1 family [Fretibacter rubidus]|uniref:phage major tail protein, TP901-1 family n=1 Tax=Fretibacter rubidus TaxID=570162 RepID=UPI00352A3C98
MSAQAGRDLLVKLKNDAGDFITLAGLRTKTLRFNARSVDVTDSESLDAWRELLPGAGTKSVEISGAGVFRDKASDAVARSAFFDQSLIDTQVIIPHFGIIEGPFLIASLSYAGTFNGEASYELTFHSAGAASFTVID